MTDLTKTEVAEPQAPRELHLGWALVLISMAQLMVVLDASIANIALPFIGEALDINDANLTWIVTGYALAFGGLLLLGGRFTDKWGHLLGTLMPIGSFGISVAMFLQLMGREEEQRQVVQHLYDWVQVGGLDVGFDLLYDPLTALFLLLITGVGSLIHVYSIGYMEHDPAKRRRGAGTAVAPNA